MVNCDDLSISPSTASTPSINEHIFTLNESPIKKSSEKSSEDVASVSLHTEEESPTNPFKVSIFTNKESVEKLLSEQNGLSAPISSSLAGKETTVSSGKQSLF
jgi:hypothetical protein